MRLMMETLLKLVTIAMRRRRWSGCSRRHRRHHSGSGRDRIEKRVRIMKMIEIEGIADSADSTDVITIAEGAALIGEWIPRLAVE